MKNDDSLEAKGRQVIAHFGKMLLVAFGFLLVGTTSAMATTTIRQISSTGTSVMRSAAVGADSIQAPEFQPGVAAWQVADGPNTAGTAGVSSKAAATTSIHGERATNRSIARDKGVGEEVSVANQVNTSSPRGTLLASFDGLNHRQTRLARGGNQFSNEPPDQGLCAGNGFVLETVNTVLNVFDTTGKSLTGPVALSAFYGYAPEINRTSHEYGPSLFDPSCYYDSDTQRWFHLAADLDVDPSTGGLLGSNHLDLAVSVTADPTGAWNIYQIPVQNDGTQGTPDHGCSLNPDGTGHGPCFGDYPHIGADKYGIYITTNEFSFFGPEFKSAQIYALSKLALARGGPIQMVQIDTADYQFEANPGFTVWPAHSPAAQYERDHGGTEYLISSLAVFNNNNTDNRLRLWALTNTASIDAPTPNLSLANGIVRVASYGVPPSATQKSGDTPLRDCVNDTTAATLYGPGCWNLLFVQEPAHTEVEARIDSNDSRIQQVVFVNGRLFTALDTSLKIHGVDQAGAAYYIIVPEVEGNRAKGEVKRQGKVGVPNNNVSYPAIAALPNGRAVMAFTLTGTDHYPTAAYVRVSESDGASVVYVAAEGAGPEDGFSGYAAYGPRTDPLSGNAPYARWGDYGAAFADGDTIWIASEYIGQTCTLSEYLTAPIGSCGGTRTSLGNWDTRISRIAP